LIGRVPYSVAFALINRRFRHARPGSPGRALVRVGALGLCNVGAIVEIETYYDTLGVPPAADARDIGTAFRRLAKQFHPDLNRGDDDAVQELKKITRAYKVLRDSAQRAAYDAHLEELRALVVPDRPGAVYTGAGTRPGPSLRQAGYIAAASLFLSVGLALAMSWGWMPTTSAPQYRAAIVVVHTDPGAAGAGAEPATIDAEPRQPDPEIPAIIAPDTTAAIAAAPERSADALVAPDPVPDAETRNAKAATLELLLAPSTAAHPAPPTPSAEAADAAPAIVPPADVETRTARATMLELLLAPPAAAHPGPSSPRAGVANAGPAVAQPKEPSIMLAAEPDLVPLSDALLSALRDSGPRPEDVPPAPERSVVVMLTPARDGAPSSRSGTDVPLRSNDAVPPPQRKREDLAQAERLVAQGQRHLAEGNFATAREYFERAADLGSALAAMKMAETHDRNVLATRRSFGPKGNQAEARKWYERAKALGLPEAEVQLHRLDAGQ
jgi:DnaJ-like protein